MGYKTIILLLFVSLFSCGQGNSAKSTLDKITTEEKKGSIPVLDYEALEPLLHMKDDKTYVINFWATWCKPCVDELPYFEELNAEYKDKNVEVILVSLDFPDKIKAQLLPFVWTNELKSRVLVLDDADQNKWVTAIDPSWSGAIPATIIYNKDKREFYEQSFDKETLVKELKKFIN